MNDRAGPHVVNHRPTHQPTRRWRVLGAAIALGVLGGCAWFRPDLAIRVATGVTAHEICSGSFVGGHTAKTVYDETLKPRPFFNLVEGWVRWSSTPSLESGYGAGFWLNRRGTKDMLHRYDMPLMPDVPADTFYGLGNLGQWIVVVPSRSLVIVRFGFTMRPYFDIEGMNRLIADTITATGGNDR